MRLGCNAFGASLEVVLGRSDVTVGGDGVNDLEALEEELDGF